MKERIREIEKVLSRTSRKLEIRTRYEIRDGKKINYISVQDRERTFFKEFRQDSKKTRLTDENLSLDYISDKTASKKSLRRYFQKRAEKQGFIYRPTESEWLESQDNTKLNETEQKFLQKHESDQTYVKDIHTFETTDNKIIFTNRRRIKNFKYTYISVKVKIFFDGYYVIAKGRSGYRFEQITDEQLQKVLNEAIRYTLKPYGSNLKFELIDWSYGYFIDVDSTKGERFR